MGPRCTPCIRGGTAPSGRGPAPARGLTGVAPPLQPPRQPRLGAREGACGPSHITGRGARPGLRPSMRQPRRSVRVHRGAHVVMAVATVATVATSSRRLCLPPPRRTYTRRLNASPLGSRLATPARDTRHTTRNTQHAPAGPPASALPVRRTAENEGWEEPHGAASSRLGLPSGSPVWVSHLGHSRLGLPEVGRTLFGNALRTTHAVTLCALAQLKTASSTMDDGLKPLARARSQEGEPAVGPSGRGGGSM